MLTDPGDGDQDVDDPADEDHSQRFVRGEPEAEDDDEGEEGVEAHARRQGVRDVGEEAHDEGPDGGSEDGGEEDGPFIESGIRQNTRVDDQDIGHRKESRKTGDDFGTDVGTILLQFEKLFQSLSPFLIVRNHKFNN